MEDDWYLTSSHILLTNRNNVIPVDANKKRDNKMILTFLKQLGSKKLLQSISTQSDPQWLLLLNAALHYCSYIQRTPTQSLIYKIQAEKCEMLLLHCVSSDTFYQSRFALQTELKKWNTEITRQRFIFVSATSFCLGLKWVWGHPATAGAKQINILNNSSIINNYKV